MSPLKRPRSDEPSAGRPPGHMLHATRGARRMGVDKALLAAPTDVSGRTGCLAGLQFAIAGKTLLIRPDAVVKIVEAFGGTLVDAPSGSPASSYLVVGDSPEFAKVHQARVLGLEKIDERELLELVRARSEAATSRAAAEGSGTTAGEIVRVSLAVVPPAAPEPIFAIYEERKGDLVVVSADGKRALVKRQKLASACHYFQALLTQPDKVHTSEGDGLPTLRVDERAAGLNSFLRAAFHPRPAQETLSFDEAKQLLLVSERFKAYHMSCLALMHLACHVVSEAPTVFALAAHAGNVSLARTALAAFGPCSLAADQPAVTTRSIKEVPADVFSVIPAAALADVLRLEGLVAANEGSWAALAPTFSPKSEAPAPDIIIIDD